MALRDLVILLAADRETAYDGTQLAAHFIRRRFGLKGDAAVAFRGPCEVRGRDLVDLEDRERGLFIRSREMVHFLVELFGTDLEKAILLQRLLADIVASRVRLGLEPAAAAAVSRRGDDVYVAGRKLTVSIATVSGVSALIHLGVNVDEEGAPVAAAGLAALGIDPDGFAEGVLADLRSEVRGVGEAACKVCPAREVGEPD